MIYELYLLSLQINRGNYCTRMAEDKITYRTYTIGKEVLADIATTLGFKEEGNEWYVYRIPHLSVKSKQKFQDAHIQVYLPTYTVEKTLDGKKVKVEKPKMLNYLFALTTFEKVESFRKLENLSPVFRHREKGTVLGPHDIWLTVPKAQMHSLMIVAQGYEQEMTFVTPEEQMLVKGDMVRVAAGQFKGAEGILVTNQGSTKGKVFVSITSGFGTMTTTIPDEYIQVLEFSRANNHFTRKMQAVEKDLDKAVLQRQAGEPLDPKLRAALQFFLFRYSALTNLTHVNNARITAYRYAARVLLGRQTEAEKDLKLYLASSTTNSALRRAITRTPAITRYIDEWREKVKNETTI